MISNSMSVDFGQKAEIIIIGFLLSNAIIYIWQNYVHYWLYQLWPVSYPGDKIKIPLTRLGSWNDKDTVLSDSWKFLTAESSHRKTECDSKDLKLLGEPAGRQTWVVDNDHKISNDKYFELVFNPARNPNTSDKLLRGQLVASWSGPKPDTTAVPKTPLSAAKKGIDFFKMIQCEDGHWAGDYGGPMFLLPGLIIAHYVTKTKLEQSKIKAMTQYFINHQQKDGGWGTHIECASTMFGTVLVYVSLRLLNVDPGDTTCILARKFIHSHGGGLMTTSWAKFWLAVLGVYSWDGICSVPAEMWMLPRWFPFHPGKMWCHARMVYLPMCYLYSSRWVYPDANADALISNIKKELYIQPYESIQWEKYLHVCNPDDVYSPIHPVMRFLQILLAKYERYGCVGPFRWLRNRGIRFAAEYMHAEDIQTNYIDIGPVNKAFHIVVTYAESRGDRDSIDFRRHLQRVDDYLWVAEDGMKMQGYNGSQCWDTSFFVQAFSEIGLGDEHPSMCQKAFQYMQKTQIKENEENCQRYFRHISKGGWPFSTSAHGWPIADCTGEGLKATLHLLELSNINEANLRFADDRLFDAVNILLSYQNIDGGWATYENNRGYGWYEWLNPSEVFGDIMIDYSYVELTSSAITALALFHKKYPMHRSMEIKKSLRRGASFLRSIQRKDGSWYGSWGVCFTYGTWFGIKALAAASVNDAVSKADYAAIVKGTSFLLSKQNPNGGFGESYLACVNKEYPAEGTKSIQDNDHGTENSGVVQTAWAMLGLIAGNSCIDVGNDKDQSTKINAALKRAAKFLMEKQLANGDWAQEGITGVFNRSCGISYSNYRNIFPIWALGLYGRNYES